MASLIPCEVETVDVGIRAWVGGTTMVAVDGPKLNFHRLRETIQMAVHKFIYDFVLFPSGRSIPISYFFFLFFFFVYIYKRISLSIYGLVWLLFRARQNQLNLTERWFGVRLPSSLLTPSFLQPLHAKFCKVSK